CADFFNELEMCRELLEFVSSTSFDPESSLGILSRVGPTLNQYKRIKQQHQLLKSVMHHVGDVDALVTIAHWCTNADCNQARFCFANYIQTDSPLLVMRGLWNIGLDSNTVVKNDVQLGTATCPKKIVITGPNKAGKSSILKAVGLNIILAQ